MIKFLVILALIYFGLRALKSLISPPGGQPRTQGPSGTNLPVTDEMLKDPYCEVYFPRKEGVPLKLEDKTLYFCSTRCRDAYQQERQQ